MCIIFFMLFVLMVFFRSSLFLRDICLFRISVNSVVMVMKLSLLSCMSIMIIICLSRLNVVFIFIMISLVIYVVEVVVNNVLMNVRCLLFWFEIGSISRMVLIEIISRKLLIKISGGDRNLVM